jgi:transcriptional regulator with XRE-family HTH domain
MITVSLLSNINDYPFAQTAACRMLAEAIANLATNHRISQRRLASHLGYKNSVSLSHMAIGRVPIPVERAMSFADVLGMDTQQFLLAVLEQRYPEIPFKSALQIDAKR